MAAPEGDNSSPGSAKMKWPYDYLRPPHGLDPATIFANAKPGSGRANLSLGLPGWYTEINPLWQGILLLLLLLLHRSRSPFRSFSFSFFPFSLLLVVPIPVHFCLLLVIRFMPSYASAFVYCSPFLRSFQLELLFYVCFRFL
jgi:hypothetical protein